MNQVAYSVLEPALKEIQKDLVIHNDKRYGKDDTDPATVFVLNPYPKRSATIDVCAPVAERKLVIMASNQVPKYSFYMPLSALVWKSRFQYESVVLLIGSEEKWKNHPPSSVVVKYLRLFGVRQIFFVDVPDNLSVFMSQVARIFAAFLPLDATENTFMLTSDADLWPIKQTLYQINDPAKEILLLNAYCCGNFPHNGKQYRMFPMGHIGMPRRIWKEIMNVQQENLNKNFTDMIMAEVKRMFNTVTMENVQHGGEGWYNDQNMISIKIGDWNGFPDKAQQETFSGRRIDRAWWPANVRGIVDEGARDAHLLHPGYERWNEVSPLLEQLVTRQEWELAEEYVKEFSASLKL